MYSRGVLPNGTVAGSATTIASTTQLETNARLTLDGEEVLAVWQRQNTGSGYDLYARTLDTNGLPDGTPFVIQETAGNQQNVAVAAGSSQRTQLAWQDDREGGWDLFAASLDRRYQVTHIQYEYDPLYRLTDADYSGDIAASYDYAYDAVGNMTAYTETVGAQTRIVNQTFNEANQLITSTDTELGTSSFYYDDNGNLVEYWEPLHPIPSMMYFYNQRNLLVKVEQPVDHVPNLPIANYNGLKN